METHIKLDLRVRFKNVRASRLFQVLSLYIDVSQWSPSYHKYVFIFILRNYSNQAVVLRLLSPLWPWASSYHILPCSVLTVEGVTLCMGYLMCYSDDILSPWNYKWLVVYIITRSTDPSSVTSTSHNIFSLYMMPRLYQLGAIARPSR